MRFFSAINDRGCGEDAHSGQYPSIEGHKLIPDIKSEII
jgi:hypothetical protein